MTIAQQLKFLERGLQPWVTQNKASLKIAHDVPHLYKILGESPGAARVALLFVSETPRDERFSDVVGRVDRKFWVAFSRGFTLEAYAGKSLVDGIAGGRPMFDLVEEARTVLRTLVVSDTDETLPYYGGIELLHFEGVTTDAYRLEITAVAETEVGSEA